MRTALAVVGAIATITMIIGIVLLTFTIYVVTSAKQLLSLPGMAILACAVVLMARDELTASIEESIWVRLQASTLRSCISGWVACESGWLIFSQPREPSSGIRRFLRFTGGNKRPLRVLRVVADDGEVMFIGWDIKTMYTESDGQVRLPDGKRYNYVKQSFTYN